MTVGETCSKVPQISIVPVLAAPLKRLSDDSKAIPGEDVAIGVGASHAEQRESRIEELRRQIQDGTYDVEVHEVSRKIIDDHLTD